MRTSLVRSLLRQNRPARIACMYYPLAMMPAHAAKAGFDAIWLDTEHNTWDRRQLQRMIALHHLADIDYIVRTGSRNPSELYHLLEDGATGIMVPFVNSAADAAARHGVAWGRPSGTAEDIARMAQKGARLIAHGSDFGSLMRMLPAFAKTLSDGLGPV